MGKTKSETREQRIARFQSEITKPGYAAHVARLQAMSDCDYYQVYFPEQGRLLRALIQVV